MQAALWSALVFPGVGHFHLQAPRRGMLLAGLSVFCLTLLTVRYAVNLNQAAQAATALDGMLDLKSLLQHAWQACREDRWMIAALRAMAGIWLIAMLDAYRLGKKRAHANQQAA